MHNDIMQIYIYCKDVWRYLPGQGLAMEKPKIVHQDFQDFLRFSRIFYDFYDFLGFSKIVWDFQNFHDFLGFSRLSQDFLRFSRIFKDFLGFFKIFYFFLRFSRICQNFFGFSKIFQNFLEYCRLNNVEYPKKSQKILENLKKSYEIPGYVYKYPYNVHHDPMGSISCRKLACNFRGASRDSKNIAFKRNKQSSQTNIL